MIAALKMAVQSWRMRGSFLGNLFPLRSTFKIAPVSKPQIQAVHGGLEQKIAGIDFAENISS